jgi:hypothetical protein
MHRLPRSTLRMLIEGFFQGGKIHPGATSGWFAIQNDGKHGAGRDDEKRSQFLLNSRRRPDADYFFSEAIAESKHWLIAKK